MSETVTVIVWSLYVWVGALPSYDIEHRPILEQGTKLIGKYETQTRCEEERNKQIRNEDAVHTLQVSLRGAFNLKNGGPNMLLRSTTGDESTRLNET